MVLRQVLRQSAIVEFIIYLIEPRSAAELLPALTLSVKLIINVRENGHLFARRLITVTSALDPKEFFLSRQF